MHAITHLLCFILTTTLLIPKPNAHAAAVPMMKNIPMGEQARKFLNDPLLEKLKLLLEQGDLEQFYEIVTPVIDQLELRTASETLEGDKIDRQLLIDRYVIIAPLIKLNENEACILKKDIRCKHGVMNDLYIISKTNLKQNVPSSRKKEIGRLCSVYAAAVIRMLRDCYHPDIEEENRNIQKRKETEWQQAFTNQWASFRQEEELYERNWKQPTNEADRAKDQKMDEKRKAYKKAIREKEDQERNLSNLLILKDLRNSSIGSFLKRRKKALVEILVDNYPGNAVEVFKYLKLAGYEEEKMMKVVDQSLGREKKTEFLYKSLLGRKFLKEKENHQQQKEPEPENVE